MLGQLLLLMQLLVLGQLLVLQQLLVLGQLLVLVSPPGELVSEDGGEAEDGGEEEKEPGHVQGQPRVRHHVHHHPSQRGT